MRSASPRTEPRSGAHGPATGRSSTWPGKVSWRRTWGGCYRLRGILDADVTPFLLFTDAFVHGRLAVRGVRVLPLVWLVEEILVARVRHDRAAVVAAVNALSATTRCYPSMTPRLA